MTAGKRPDAATRAAQDRRLVAMFMAGATTEQVAEALDLSPDTVRRRARGDAVRALLADAEREVIERTGRAVQTAATHGLRVLLEAATSAAVPWPQRVSAARSLVTFAGYPQGVQTVADDIDAEMEAAAETLVRKMDGIRARLIEAESREVPAVPALRAPARAESA
jgi:hypothetical protein